MDGVGGQLVHFLKTSHSPISANRTPWNWLQHPSFGLVLQLPNQSTTESNHLWRCNWVDDDFQGFFWGSGLSPLLFNISVRKLPKQCTSSTFQFTDDTTLATANPSLSAVAENLMASLYAVKEFCDSHKLKINPEKTQLIVFKKPGKSIPDNFQLMLDKNQSNSWVSP